MTDQAINSNVTTIENIKLEQPCNSNSIVANSASSTLSVGPRIKDYETTCDIEDSLEPHLRSFVKNVYSAYRQSIGAYADMPINLSDDMLPLGFYFQDCQEYNQVFKFLDCNVNKCISFLQKSLGNYLDKILEGFFDKFLKSTSLSYSIFNYI